MSIALRADVYSCHPTQQLRIPDNIRVHPRLKNLPLFHTPLTDPRRNKFRVPAVARVADPCLYVDISTEPIEDAKYVRRAVLGDQINGTQTVELWMTRIKPAPDVTSCVILSKPVNDVAQISENALSNRLRVGLIRVPARYRRV